MQLPMSMHCDNEVVIFIVNNFVFHEWTKHIEVNCHYDRDVVMSGIISTPITLLSDQLVDIFTKGSSLGTFKSLCNKLDVLDIYAPI